MIKDTGRRINNRNLTASFGVVRRVIPVGIRWTGCAVQIDNRWVIGCCDFNGRSRHIAGQLAIVDNHRKDSIRCIRIFGAVTETDLFDRIGVIGFRVSATKTNHQFAAKPQRKVVSDVAIGDDRVCDKTIVIDFNRADCHDVTRLWIGEYHRARFDVGVVHVQNSTVRVGNRNGDRSLRPTNRMVSIRV